MKQKGFSYSCLLGHCSPPASLCGPYVALAQMLSLTAVCFKDKRQPLHPRLSFLLWLCLFSEQCGQQVFARFCVAGTCWGQCQLSHPSLPQPSDPGPGWYLSQSCCYKCWGHLLARSRQVWLKAGMDGPCILKPAHHPASIKTEPHLWIKSWEAWGPTKGKTPYIWHQKPKVAHPITTDKNQLPP